MGQGRGLAVRDDLLDHGVVAVFPLGPQRCGGLVGEEGVVAPDGKQLVLLAHDGGFGQVTDPAHDRRAVTRSAFLRPVNAVYSGISATSASEMSSPVSGSGTAVG
jgi:hypothetical protein